MYITYGCMYVCMWHSLLACYLNREQSKVNIFSNWCLKNTEDVNCEGSKIPVWFIRESDYRCGNLYIIICNSNPGDILLGRSWKHPPPAFAQQPGWDSFHVSWRPCISDGPAAWCHFPPLFGWLRLFVCVSGVPCSLLHEQGSSLVRRGWCRHACLWMVYLRGRQWRRFPITFQSQIRIYMENQV